MTRKNNFFADKLGDTIAPDFLHEKAAQLFRRQILQQICRIKAIPGLGEYRLIEVGREKLKFSLLSFRLKKLKQRHGQGIDFLPRGTARRPDAQGHVARLLEQFWKHPALQGLKSF